MKIRNISLFTFILLLATCTYVFGQSKESIKYYSVEQLKEDLSFAKKMMERFNVNLYLYSSKEIIDAKFAKLDNGIQKPMTASEFYKYITSIQTTIKDGHNILLPSDVLQTFYPDSSLYFPLNFVEFNNRLFVTQNISNDSTVKIGDEILEINSTNAGNLYQFVVDHLPRDGENDLNAKYNCQTYFRSYHGFMFGFPETYNIKFKTINETIVSKSIDAVPIEIIEKRRRLASIKRYDGIDHERGIYWKFDDENQYAYLFLKDWSTKGMKEAYNLDHKKEFKKFFDELRSKGTDNIIIDLRGNSGGDASNGIDFLKYVLNEPFKYFHSVKKFNKKGFIVDASKELSKTYKPYRKKYNGSIYVLTNGGTYSNSCIFSEIIRKYNRGIILGTNTGGCGKILSGGVGFFKLPNTNINLLKVTRQMITLKDYNSDFAGVIPDIIIEPSLEQILNNDDTVLKEAIKMCTKK